jgi:predicted negative regulator of RcsB-dependent stress response
LTRHELRDQVQHDVFKESVENALGFTIAHRTQVIRWAVVAVIVLLIVGVGMWYSASHRAARQRDLEAAFQVLSAPVGPATQFGKTFPTEDAKRQASLKAFSDVVAKDGGTKEGLIAQYYLGTMKAQQDAKGAESDLRTVANSSSDVAPLAKIALAQLYAGENRVPEAQELLRGIVNKPTALVSKSQAEVMLAQLDAATNPQQAKKILESLKSPNEDPAVARAVDQLSTQLAR